MLRLRASRQGLITTSDEWCEKFVKIKETFLAWRLPFVEAAALQVHTFSTWGFPKIRGTILGLPMKRIIVCYGLYWGPPIERNFDMYSQN